MPSQQLKLPQRSFQLAGFILLFIASYLDNVRGPLLPVIGESLEINYEVASRLLTIGNISACAALILLIPLMKTMSEGNSAKAGAIFVIIAGVISNFVTDENSLYVFAVFVGIGTAVFGVVSNIFVMRGTHVSQHANMLSGLQVMYGMSSMLAPLMVAFLISKNWNWQLLFTGLIPVTVFLLLFLQFGVAKHSPAPQKQSASYSLSRNQKLLLLTFCFYVIAEVSCSMWMTPFLVEIRNMSIEEASIYTSGFFFFMMVSRILCFFFLTAKNREIILYTSLFAPLFFVLGALTYKISWLLPLAGLYGPFWPIFVSKVTKTYPDEWRSLTLWLVFGLQASLLIMNFSMGKLSTIFDMEQAYFISPIFQVLTIISFFTLRKFSKSF